MIYVMGNMWDGFQVTHAKVEQLSIKGKTLKHDIYRTTNFLSTSEAKTRLIGQYLVPSVVKVSICFMFYCQIFEEVFHTKTVSQT